MNGTYQVRKLSAEEKKKTISLYREAFPEDDAVMTDCVYRLKMPENEVFAAVFPDGHIGGMLWLNPYRVMIRDRAFPLSYIVAVATEKAHRREGIMRAVLTEALSFLRQQSGVLRGQGSGIPFTYLKPANPAYYTPFGFTWISERERRRVKQTGELLREELSSADALMAADFMNRFLEERYEVYCSRDPHYVSSLLSELKAGGGSASMLFRRERMELCGVEFRDEEEVPAGMSRLLLPEALTEPVPDDAGQALPPDRFMMGRIVDLKAFLELFDAETPVSAEFFFDDPLIPENRGWWRWEVAPDGSRAVCAGTEKRAPDDTAAVFSPEALTAWLFGRGPAPGAAWCGSIRPLSRVYFDEEI